MFGYPSVIGIDRFAALVVIVTMQLGRFCLGNGRVTAKAVAPADDIELDPVTSLNIGALRSTSCH